MIPAERKPDLFLVGAPKCGTTSLYSYLQRHPDVFMSTPKEPQFFADDILGHQRNVTSLPAYLECFAGANGKKWVGEASTAYLGSARAPCKIKTFSPGARIIIMLRNPIDVMYAQHSERYFSQMEHIRDFEAAIDSHEERKWRSGPFSGQDVIRLSYRELSRYVEAVARYFDTFGREKVHVIIFDDFRSNVSVAFNELLRSLDLSPAANAEYEVVNENRRARNAALQRFVNYPPKAAQSMFRRVVPRSLRAAMVRAVSKLNVVDGLRAPMNRELRTRLQKECKPDVEALSRLLNRDLLHWCENGS